VFIGGDYANGGAEIVNAAAEGKQAAAAIHKMLGP
jgi:NADPH-dependent glutamate synthase beta subunit-like oxidoreductase